MYLTLLLVLLHHGSSSIISSPSSLPIFLILPQHGKKKIRRKKDLQLQPLRTKHIYFSVLCIFIGRTLSLPLPQSKCKLSTSFVKIGQRKRYREPNATSTKVNVVRSGLWCISDNTARFKVLCYITV